MTVIQEINGQHFHFTPGWVKWVSPEEARTLSEGAGVAIRYSPTVEDFQRQIWNHLDNEFSVNELLVLASAPVKWLQASWARPGSTTGSGGAADVKAIAAAVDAALSDNFAAVLASVAGADEATLATFGLKRA